jgi:hypothetical protein
MMIHDSGDSVFSEAVGFLAKEQSLAESYAVLVKEFGKQDLENYAEAILLYANAKAEYDGLIEQMKYDLRADRKPDDSSELQNKLRKSADRRVAFTSFVAENVIHRDTNRKIAIVTVAIKAVPDLINALTKSAISIWREYHGLKGSEKKGILDELDMLKWKPFQDAGSKK